ncbi:MAG: hypothetical protein WAV09_01240 [Minisyncoccia bacterium]
MKTLLIEVTLEEGESVMRGECVLCGWKFERVFTVGDDERADAQDDLANKHELNTNCEHPLEFSERS